MDIPSRIIFITVLILGGMINFYWKASIISNLSVSLPNIPFRSMNELIKSPYQITLIKDSSYQELFEKSDNPVFQAAWRTKFVDKSQSLKESLEEMVPLVVDGHYAMFEGVSSIHTLQEYQDCKITDSGLYVSKMDFAFTLQKNSQYTQLFNDGMKKMVETGTLKRITTKHQTARPTCNEKNKGVPLALTNIAFAFLILIIGFGLCFVLFILESIQNSFFRLSFSLTVIGVLSFLFMKFYFT